MQDIAPLCTHDHIIMICADEICHPPQRICLAVALINHDKVAVFVAPASKFDKYPGHTHNRFTTTKAINT